MSNNQRVSARCTKRDNEQISDLPSGYYDPTTRTYVYDRPLLVGQGDAHTPNVWANHEPLS
jgi:hypothetical protein